MRRGGTPYMVDLWANSSCPKAGTTLVARAIVRNTGKSTWIVEMKDRPVFDVFIDFSVQGGGIRKRWSDGKPLTSDLTRIELGPGESKTIELQAVVPTGVGITDAMASFMTDPRFPDEAIKPFMPLYDCYLFGPSLSR